MCSITLGIDQWNSLEIPEAIECIWKKNLVLVLVALGNDGKLLDFFQLNNARRTYWPLVSKV